SSDKRLHFGLGTADKAKVEIAWPSGIHQTLNDVPADQFLEVREPEKP
ncbi:MAG: ASPIC/UnbV domain-containing protein, partial [Candidatus Sulfotelmatobacter sp.]